MLHQSPGCCVFPNCSVLFGFRKEKKHMTYKDMEDSPMFLLHTSSQAKLTFSQEAKI